MSGSLESLNGLYNLRILDLSHNYFSNLGGLDFSNMSNLAELYLADNKFGGTVDRVTVHFRRNFSEISVKSHRKLKFAVVLLFKKFENSGL